MYNSAFYGINRTIYNIREAGAGGRKRATPFPRGLLWPQPVLGLRLIPVPSGSSREEAGEFLVQRDRPGEDGLHGAPAGGPQAAGSHEAPALHGRCRGVGRGSTRDPN